MMQTKEEVLAFDSATFGEWLKAQRDYFDVTVTDVGQVCGVDDETVEGFEKGDFCRPARREAIVWFFGGLKPKTKKTYRWKPKPDKKAKKPMLIPSSVLSAPKPAPAPAPKPTQPVVKDSNVPVKSTDAAPKPAPVSKPAPSPAPKSAQVSKPKPKPVSAPTLKPVSNPVLIPVSMPDPNSAVLPVSKSMRRTQRPPNRDGYVPTEKLFERNLSFSEWLKAQRMFLRLTQAEMAGRIGYQWVTSYARLERGERVPSFGTKMRIIQRIEDAVMSAKMLELVCLLNRKGRDKLENYLIALLADKANRAQLVIE